MSDPTGTYVADAELSALLASAHGSGQRLHIAADGNTYELEVKSLTSHRNQFSGYSAARIREVLKQSSGIITADEAERMKRLIYDAREQSTRPLNRP